jgi:hypothetical protein
MTNPRVVVVNDGVPPVSAKLARAFAEDAAAIASWAEAQGYPEDAEVMRTFRDKLLAVVDGGKVRSA